MTTIAVLPTAGPTPGYRAVTGGREASGATPGQALAALAAQTKPPSGPTLVVFQPPGADEFFPTDRRDRLAELMARWRRARDAGGALPPAEQAELDALAADELRAAAARTAALLRAAPYGP